jgi:uncharacterized protein YciI
MGETDMVRICLLALALCLPPSAARAGGAPVSSPACDAELAKQTGADERGMRNYVLAILNTGPRRMPDGPERDAMFAGHFANMERLAKEGKLALAGPFATDPDGWRGLFVFAVESIDEAKALAATDPVIAKGEMVAEYHAWYGSAATMLVPELHGKLQPPRRNDRGRGALSPPTSSLPAPPPRPSSP